MANKVTKIIEEDGQESFRVEKTTSHLMTFSRGDLDLEISQVQKHLDELLAKKAKFEAPDETIDKREK